MRSWERFAAIEACKLPTAHRAVLWVVSAAMRHDRPYSWLSVQTIARRAGLSERQARVILTDLRDRAILIPADAGEKKTRVMAIGWDALTAALPAMSQRGRRRTEPEETTGKPEETAPEVSNGYGHDRHPEVTSTVGEETAPQDRKSLPTKPEETAPEPGRNREREHGTEPGSLNPAESRSAQPVGPTDHPPTPEADGRELTIPQRIDLLPAGFPRPLTLDSPHGPLVVPGDLPAFLAGLSFGRSVPALVLATAGIESTRDLLRLDAAGLRYCPGIGEARAQKVAEFVRDHYGIDWPPKGSKILRHQLAREAFDLALESA